MPARTRHRPRAAALLLAAVVVACAEPAPPPTDPGEGAEEPLAAEPLDPTREELIAQLDRLGTSISATRGHLEAAVTAGEEGDGAEMRSAADDAVSQLLDAAGPDADPAPLLPSAASDRTELEDRDDALTATLVAAREAGGDLGRTTLDLLRDPIAGDVGAWERDAPGVVEQIRAAAAEGPDPAAADEAITALDGDAPRALAWSLVAADAPSADDGAQAAARALAHLEVVELALAVVAEVAGDGTGDAADPGADPPDVEEAPTPEELPTDGEDPASPDGGAEDDA